MVEETRTKPGQKAMASRTGIFKETPTGEQDRNRPLLALARRLVYSLRPGSTNTFYKGPDSK